MTQHFLPGGLGPRYPIPSPVAQRLVRVRVRICCRRRHHATLLSPTRASPLKPPVVAWWRGTLARPAAAAPEAEGVGAGGGATGCGCATPPIFFAMNSLTSFWTLIELCADSSAFLSASSGVSPAPAAPSLSSDVGRSWDTPCAGGADCCSAARLSAAASPELLRALALSR
eukprot:CAMPEP_0180378808 /NCGR_PEP_ID=MMETSP0989-20121125/24943_1 /TAXON_ID=697907 /ORGANISM="non described non described, Strain CCMP2293" /LENGTH=170 /DNA_ID=CAMNT_0022377709 /DNA_START=160 /DNA_END=669 /DNA_ORIENTATION=+